MAQSLPRVPITRRGCGVQFSSFSSGEVPTGTESKEADMRTLVSTAGSFLDSLQGGQDPASTDRADVRHVQWTVTQPRKEGDSDPGQSQDKC